MLISNIVSQLPYHLTLFEIFIYEAEHIALCILQTQLLLQAFALTEAYTYENCLVILEQADQKEHRHLSFENIVGHLHRRMPLCNSFSMQVF